jgi:hypothetical protein
MALGFVTSLRTSRANAIVTAIGTSGKLRFYAGTRPATGGAETTILATCPLSATAGSVSNGVLTFNAITNDSSIDATGTVSWFRIMTSADAAVIDGSVTATGGGGDITTPSTSWTATEPLAVSSLVFTEGNA